MASTVSFEKFYNIVNNEKREAQKTYHGINPSTEEALWEVPVATEQDVEEAVAAANAAFKKWRLVPREEKNEYIKRFADALEKHKAELTSLLHKENGKPEAFAASEIDGAIMTIRLHVDWKTPEHVTNDTEKVKVVTKYVPVGVVGGILPWNYPFHLSITKLSPALVTGCTIILKPSPFTPYTALKLGEIATQVFPPGVVQVLGGDDKLGPWLTTHPDVAKISFTGSIATGKKVMAAAASTLKRVSLELGGNDAAVITEDVDIAKTAQQVGMAAFVNSGQVCVATKRIYVQESIYPEFMEHFTKVVKSFTPGEGFCGPVQNRMQYDKVRSIFDDCVTQKYEFAVGDGKLAADKSGYFAPPTVVARPPEKSRIVQEEPFGPIVPVLTFSKDEDAIERANDTVTGLGATVYCRDQDRAWRIAESLDTGSVWVNGGLAPDPTALFGGHKQSGIGMEFGPLALTYYCNPRTVTFWK